MAINFTKDHIRMIKHRQKTSTLRTIKKKHFYKEGATVEVEDSNLEIEIYSRSIVMIKRKPVDPDAGTFIDRKELAESEGFKNYKELVEWFQDRNYNLPQNFFRYRFRPVTGETNGG